MKNIILIIVLFITQIINSQVSFDISVSPTTDQVVVTGKILSVYGGCKLKRFNGRIIFSNPTNLISVDSVIKGTNYLSYFYTNTFSSKIDSINLYNNSPSINISTLTPEILFIVYFKHNGFTSYTSGICIQIDSDIYSTPSGGNICATNDSVCVPPNTVLPVNLINFYKNGNELNWVTSQEKNILIYEIQSSENAEKWNYLGEVYSKGNSYSKTTYSFISNSDFKYYRLKILDLNEEFVYSNVITVVPGEKYISTLFDISGKEIKNVNYLCTGIYFESKNYGYKIEYSKIYMK